MLNISSPLVTFALNCLSCQQKAPCHNKYYICITNIQQLMQCFSMTDMRRSAACKTVWGRGGRANLHVCMLCHIKFY